MNELAKHVLWLQENHENSLNQAALREGLNLSSLEILSDLSAADPSAKKRAVQWLFTCWTLGSIEWADIEGEKESRAYYLLEQFSFVRDRLDGKARNLQSYSSLDELEGALKLFLEPEESAKSLKRKEKHRALQESILVHRSKNLIVAVPKTKAAAQWWGKGTQWCTSSSQLQGDFDLNQFYRYNKLNPLVVAVFPDGLKGEGVRKFQIWPGDRSHGEQFMDENDQQVTASFVREHWPQFEPIFRWLIVKYARGLEYLPAEFEHNTLLQEMIANVPYSLEKALALIPQDEQKNFLTETLSMSPGILTQVPIELRSDDLDLTAARADAKVILSIPMHLRDREICNRAVAADPNLLQFVPYKNLSLEMCLDALERGGRVLQWVPSHWISPEILHLAVQRNLANFLAVPQNMVTPEMALFVVEKHPSFMEDISGEIKTEEFCKQALSLNINVIAYCPKYILTRERIDAALKQNPSLFWNLKSTGMIEINQILELARANSISLKDVPAEERTSEICKELVAANGYNLQWVPEELITLEICELAVEQNPFAVEDVPMEMRTAKICKLAVEKNQDTLCYVPAYLFYSQDADYFKEARKRADKNIRAWHEDDLDMLKISFQLQDRAETTDSLTK